MKNIGMAPDKASIQGDRFQRMHAERNGRIVCGTRKVPVVRIAEEWSQVDCGSCLRIAADKDWSPIRTVSGR